MEVTRHVPLQKRFTTMPYTETENNELYIPDADESCHCFALLIFVSQ